MGFHAFFIIIMSLKLIILGLSVIVCQGTKRRRLPDMQPFRVANVGGETRTDIPMTAPTDGNEHVKHSGMVVDMSKHVVDLGTSGRRKRKRGRPVWSRIEHADLARWQRI